MSMSSRGFRANAPTLEVPSVERDLARIPSVMSARVVVEDDALHEIHIVCGTGRSPKLIGRDVQSLLAARWGVDIDHRKVSVVQLEEGDPVVVSDAEPRAEAPVEPPGTTVGPAPQVLRVAVVVTADAAEATVTLAVRGREATGEARGIPSWAAQRRLAASAALDAIASVEGGAYELGDVNVVGSGPDSIVVCAVSAWRDGWERTFAGAASVGTGGELRAAAESVLRAVPLGWSQPDRPEVHR